MNKQDAEIFEKSVAFAQKVAKCIDGEALDVVVSGCMMTAAQLWLQLDPKPTQTRKRRFRDLVKAVYKAMSQAHHQALVREAVEREVTGNE